MFDSAFYSLTELPARFLEFNLSLLRHPLELIYDNNILGFAFYSLTELPVRFLGFNLSLLRHPLELNYDINIFGVIEANSSNPS